MGFIDYWLMALLFTDHWFWPKILVTTDFCDVEFNHQAPKYTDFCENSFIDNWLKG